MGPFEWLLLITLSILWGGSFFFVGVIVGNLPPLTIVLLRVGLAAIALNIIVRVLGQGMKVSREVWLAFFGMGILNNVIPFCLIVWGQTHIASGLASILNATTPLFTVLVAHFLTDDEKLTGLRGIGIIVGFIGVIIMIGADVISNLGVNVFGQLAILGAALSYSFAGIFGRRFSRMGVSPLQTATGQVTGSSTLLLPIVALIDQPWTLTMPSIPVWAAILGLALLSTVLAYIIFFRILATAGATNLSLVTFLIPVSAILLGARVLGERLEVKHFVGMALIGVGLAAIDGRLFRWIGRDKVV
ncbi:MAG: DMT family transporter [Chloroflexota bacterium]